MVACEHHLFLAMCCVKPEISRVFALQAFLHESLHHTLLLCDRSVPQSTNKPQTQKEKNVVRMWAAVSLGGA